MDRIRAPTALLAALGVALASAAGAGAGVATKQARKLCPGSAAGRTAAPRDDTGQAARMFTPIGQAALYGDIKAVERQLNAGANVNAVSARGMTPLMWSFRPLILPPRKTGWDRDAQRAYRARQTGKLRIARTLLDRGADIALADCDGMTALHYLVLMYAEERAVLDILRAFVAKGVDPNVSNRGGQTPLMFAAQRNRLLLVTYLLAAGADPTATAKDGDTALSMARERGHAAMARLLERGRR